ncbi:MAG: hypothetical protein VKN72_09650 [Nostocales cyanobacterium 94392]|nr:hypothetical protein [Nostocales cyanobacterium 94392]
MKTNLVSIPKVLGYAIQVLAPDLDQAETRAYAVIASLVCSPVDEPNYAILRRFAEELDVQLRGVGGTEKVDKFGFPAEEIKQTIKVGAFSLFFFFDQSQVT